MKWTITTPPSGSLNGFNTIKSHLRLDSSDERDYVLQLEAAAVGYAEDALASSLLTQTITAKFYPQEAQSPFNGGTVPYFNDLILPRGPVQSIVSIHDGDNVAITDYSLERVGVADRLHLNVGYAYPLTVVYLAGYGTSNSVPAQLKQAVLLHVGTLYENRESVISGTIISKVPHTLEDFYRLRSRNTGVG